MTNYDDLIERLRTESSNPDMDNEAADAIKELVAERDAWKEDAADRDDIEGALEQSEKSRQDWRERAEKAEADLAAAREALLALTADGIPSFAWRHKPTIAAARGERPDDTAAWIEAAVYGDDVRPDCGTGKQPKSDMCPSCEGNGTISMGNGMYLDCYDCGGTGRKKETK
jgi:hypothetical protein